MSLWCPCPGNPGEQTLAGDLIDLHTDLGDLIDLETDLGDLIDLHTDLGDLIDLHADLGDLIDLHTDLEPTLATLTKGTQTGESSVIPSEEELEAEPEAVVPCHLGACSRTSIPVSSGGHSGDSGNLEKIALSLPLTTRQNQNCVLGPETLGPTSQNLGAIIPQDRLFAKHMKTVMELLGQDDLRIQINFCNLGSAHTKKAHMDFPCGISAGTSSRRRQPVALLDTRHRRVWDPGISRIPKLKFLGFPGSDQGLFGRYSSSPERTRSLSGELGST